MLPWVSMTEALSWGMGGRPSPTVTAGGTTTGGAEPIAHLSRWTERSDWVVRSNYGTSGDPRNRGVRSSSEPSFTVTSKTGRNVATHMGDVYNSHGCVRPIDSPSPTLTSSMDNGNFRWNGGNHENSTRVSVEEAGVLQSFPRDYPWRGTKSSQYQQVGNAVPPLLAAALLRQVL